MKTFILTFAVSAALTLPSTAQEYQGCFMVNRSGRVIRLDSICPTAQVQSSQATPTEDLRPIAYADAYCNARRDGYPSDVARRRGVIAMQNVERGANNTVVQAAVNKAGEMCPEFQ